MPESLTKVVLLVDPLLKEIHTMPQSRIKMSVDRTLLNLWERTVKAARLVFSRGLGDFMKKRRMASGKYMVMTGRILVKTM
jgi:hypothetical protein